VERKATGDQKGKCYKHESERKILLNRQHPWEICAAIGILLLFFIFLFSAGPGSFLIFLLFCLWRVDNAGMQTMAGKMLAKRFGSVVPRQHFPPFPPFPHRPLGE